MIYLDYAAAAPLRAAAYKAMLPHFKEQGSSASSIHQAGQMARNAIDEARNLCIELLGAFKPKEIIFTSSGTESCNMAIMGAAFARQDSGKHIIVSAFEHPAVMGAAQYLRDNFGFELDLAPITNEGFVDIPSLKQLIKKDTILVSVMAVNNEIGTIQPIKEIAALCREKGILFHTDACQAPGYANIRVDEVQPDLMTLNGSKIGSGKGAGLLYIRSGVKITPLHHGGGQEFRMRGGTENTAAIVGFAAALQVCLEKEKKEKKKTQKLRDKLLKELLEIPGVSLNGSAENKTANNINLSIDGKLGENLVMQADFNGLALSSGSACSSGKTEPSQTLLAMGQSKEKALASLRITLGHATTTAEIKKAARILSKILLP